jgi:short-subunit dehydrogenase
MAVYYATKAYVISFSEAIAEELRKTGVSVTTLCPGPTITEFQKRSGMDTTMLFKGPFTMKSMPVAKAALRGMDKGKVIVIPGISNKIFAQCYRFFPRAMVRRSVYFVQRKLGRDKTKD